MNRLAIDLPRRCRGIAAAMLGALTVGACYGPPGTVSPRTSVRPGLEALLADSAHLVQGVRVGLLTNQSGVDRAGVSGVDRLLAEGVRLVALFSAEHGFRGAARPGEAVASTVDSATGLPIYSLYGSAMAASLDSLARIDVILIDLQDVGARYYTWLHTTIEVMRAAQRVGKRVVVLDRPNPIGGMVQGNVLDTAFATAVGRLAIPMRHGMTLGELALLARGDLGLQTDLRVVPVGGWWKALSFDVLDVPFIPPSPNLASLEALYHYPGTCLFEGTAYSVGRGTPDAFTQIGAPWLDTAAVLRRLRSTSVPGVRFESVQFTPTAPGDGKFADTALAGIRLRLTDPHRYDPTRAAVELLVALQAVHPDRMGWIVRHFDRLAGTASLREQVTAGARTQAILEGWRDRREAFLARRTPFLLYR